MFPWVGAPRGEHPKALRFAVLEPLSGELRAVLDVLDRASGAAEKKKRASGPKTPTPDSEMRKEVEKGKKEQPASNVRTTNHDYLPSLANVKKE